jgi:hypothetical protein
MTLTHRMVLWLPAALVLGCGAPHAHDGTSTIASVSAQAITLKTAVSGQFLTAENGGGGAIDANRATASTWETFQLQDTTNATLQNGDLVHFQVLDGLYWCAENGGGGQLDATRQVASTWETFRVLKLTPGDAIVRNGDSIALQTYVTGNYLSALNGGGGSVVADRTAIQSWETFIVGMSGGGGGGGNACSGSQLAACNCPSGFYCCPTDGSCFQNPSDVIYTMCKNGAAPTCLMGGSGGGGGPPPPPPPPPPPGLPTRLRVTSHCGQPIWIAHSDNIGDPQNIQLGNGQSYDYQIPAGGVLSARFWPKTGCDGSGHNCAIGDNGQGGGVPCPANGCQPPIDSKFEVSYAAVGSSAATYYNLSQVDGYTLPFKVTPAGSGANSGSCVVADCSQLALAGCPAGENMSGGGAFPQYGNEDLRVRDGAGNVIGCMAPCKKWNYPAPWGLGQPEGNDPGLHLCCPTPIDPATGQCTVANHCMTADACRNTGDPMSVTHTSYVAAVHAMCPTAYSYSYDDAAGLHTCSSQTGFEVTFCP